jgi:cell division protein FtsZ
MIHFDLPKEKSSIIKVIGVGGGGSNAVNHMFSQNIEGVNFIICNTDAQAIALSQVPNKVQLGPHLTQGLGAGANPDIGRQATEESLEEIKRILEVNTKMAFITAGMGGGTGTGGAPIISKICRELGILTVGIVTTPFSYEGRKRQLQAEEGIMMMKSYVDTLLVISNDKLRHQFGNLKMKEAFSRADNVLATAAKCITDVINSTGQINVDFADVCTVMRNGGVAILGSAATGGENRAQRAIEEALASPLLNDNEIRGAKWILININSAEGEHEFTMDEVDIIQNYLLSEAGEGTDVILGLGYDNSLEDKIGITLIATGFEHKDPFKADKKSEQVVTPKIDEKIILTLGAEPTALQATPTPEVVVEPVKEAPVYEEPIREELAPTMTEVLPKFSPLELFTMDDYRNNTVDNAVEKSVEEERTDWVLSQPSAPFETQVNNSISDNHIVTNSPSSAASGGYLAKPSNIYAEPSSSKEQSPKPLVNEPASLNKTMSSDKEEDPSAEIKLVIKEEVPVADESWAHQTQENVKAINSIEEPAMQDEVEIQKRKAAERIQKLRNLSFNINSADPNNEFETVPAYIRRNLELNNNSSHVESFYSNYEVKADNNNSAQISTINTFLDGKKPD